MRKLRKRAGPFFLVSFVSALSIASYVILKHKLRVDTTNCSATAITPPGSANNSEIHVIPPVSGTVLVRPESDCVAPLIVEIKDSCNYYIYLECIKPIENSTLADSPNPGNGCCFDIGFYASADSSIFLKAPPGVYRLYFASGKDWCGLADKFGPATKYCKASQMLTFSKDGNRLYGNSIQIYPQTENNSAYFQIGLTEFPG